MHYILVLLLVATFLAAPSTSFGERPSYLKEEAGGLAVYMGVMETAAPGVVWKGDTPKPEDTHHLVFLFRNAKTGRAENTQGIKLNVRAPSGAVIFDAPVKQFVAKGIASCGKFLQLTEEGKHEAVVSFSQAGKEHRVTFVFRK